MGVTTNKAFGMGLESLLQNDLALLPHGFSLSRMHDGGCQQPQSRVVVLLVIPMEELASPTAGIGQTTEAVRIVLIGTQGV